MPRRPPRPCPTPGCPRRLQPGERCPDHSRPAWQHTEPSAAKRGYDHDWAKLRARVLRAHPICQWPGCDQASTEVDHIVPLHPTPGRPAGARLDRGNLQALCHHHHHVKSQRDKAMAPSA